ncbi:GNAT family N-acetyltransferase [Parerythrobacter aestuarii]|uniref:GNAT family N-acetyltransferase n=1 Tax=Parerythrobacter aestuarii TaxID=3020909 RepID=UPI0024DE0528|nr:N-acetyltransferase [Parerythrobacter aestuarii]
MTVSIRSEQPGDERAIRALTDAAFRDMPHADGDEGELIERLRVQGDLVLSLVACNSDKAIVGHISFSPVAIAGSEGKWYQLAPVSVIPSGQNSGIGSSLIEAGLDRLQGSGAAGILLVGDPDYYSRFGFTREHALTLSDALDPYLQMLQFEGDPPSGQITLAPAFG